MIGPRPARLLALLALTAVAGCASAAPPAPASPGGAPGPATTAPLPSAAGSPETGQPLPLLIDTDVAADDLVALAFLLASPEVDIRAITVSGSGEAHCGPGVDVVLRLLERLEAPPIDVACGRETPMDGSRTFPDAWRESVDGGSGLDLPETSRQPVDGDAVELISRVAGDTDGLRVLTLGPLTNLADALGRDPGLAKCIAGVDVMGGALHVPGNVSFGGPPINKVAEWNIYVDPVALEAVITSDVPVRLVSLDGTSQVPLRPEFAARVTEEATAPGATVLADLLALHPFMTDGTYYLWDPLAAAITAGHPLGSFSPARVDVEVTEGPAVGFTRPVEGEPNIQYLSAVDPAAAEETLLRVLNDQPGP